MGTQQEAKDRLERRCAMFVRGNIRFGFEVYALAAKETKPSVIAAIDDIDAWMRSCYLALRVALNAVDAAPDEATWDAVAIDFAALEATKPAVTTLQQLAQL